MSHPGPRLAASLPALGLVLAMAGCGDVQIHSVSVHTTPKSVLEPEAPAEPAPTPAEKAKEKAAGTPAPNPAPAPKDQPKDKPAPTATALAAGLTVAAAPTPIEEIRLDAIPFAGLKARLAADAARRGAKLTVVDVWSSTCLPCKENFPHLVGLHAKLGGKGLAVVSLSLDPPDEPAAVASAEAFLREQKAGFTNLRLSDDPTIVYETFDFAAIPAVLLFRPDGSLLRKFTMDDPNHQFTYDEVEKAIEARLAGKD